MSQLVHKLGEALLLGAGMVWNVGWSLVLGFMLSGLIQALVSQQRMREALGRNGPHETALALVFGAANSSCSYASAAVSRTLFKRGAGPVPSLALLFSSTNLVIELGIVLLLLLGWQFTAAEWLGGLVPARDIHVRAQVTHFGLNTSFWLDLLFGAGAAGLFALARRHPMPTHHHATAPEPRRT